MNQETSTADQGRKVYKLNGLEALGNKTSPRERCPRGQRRRCFAQDSAGMDGLKREKKPGKGPQNPKTKRATTAGKSGPTAGKKSIANCRQTTNNHHSYRGSPDTDHSTRWQRRQAKQHRGADDSDSAQRSEAQQSQFIKETIEIPASAQRETEIRKSWKNLHYIAMMRRLNSSPQCSEDCRDVARIKSTGKRVR